MKIEKFNEAKNNKIEYFQIRQIFSNDEYIIIPPDENEFRGTRIFGPVARELRIDDVINFIAENGEDYHHKLKVYKITEQELTENDLEILLNMKKYNT